MSIEVPGHKPDSRDFPDKLPVSQWERHEAKPSVDEVEAMCEWLENQADMSDDPDSKLGYRCAVAMLRSLSVRVKELEQDNHNYIGEYKSEVVISSALREQVRSLSVDATRREQFRKDFKALYGFEPDEKLDMPQRAQPQDGD
jgi:hypothetical protein